jgi:hypothetical protein
MQSISITNRDLDYGIDVDTLFWVSEGILSRDNVRQSRDEELVADIVAYMVSDDPLSSRTEFLDDFYGMGFDGSSQERFTAIDTAVRKRSADLVIIDFQRTLDQLRLILAHANLTFVQLIFSHPISPAPRYFQVVFLAFYDLIVRKNLAVSDPAKLVECLRNSGDHIDIQEGGRWGADNRQKTIESAIGQYQKAFSAAGAIDPALVHWVTQLQNLLSQSYTEQAAYEFKQGFLTLDGTNAFDEESFLKILKTCVAISNIGRGKKGYVLIGIVESDQTAARIESLFATRCLTHDRFKISGIEHEAKALGKTLDQFFQLIVDKITRSMISQPLRSYITSNVKSVRYYDKTVYVLETVGQGQPSLYDGKYYERAGTQVKEILPADFPAFFAKYNA